MTTQAIAPQKQYYIVTGINFVSVDIELFTDPLAYGRALRETERQHARGEVEAYTCGDNMVNNDRKNPIYGGLYIASMSDWGAIAEFFADETEYRDRMLALKSEGIDAMDYNGPDFDLDDENEDDNDNEEATVMAP